MKTMWILPLALTVCAAAQVPGGIRHKALSHEIDAPKSYERIRSFLALTDGQLQQLQQIQQQAGASIEALLASSEQKEQALRSALSAASPDAGAVGRAVLDTQTGHKQAQQIRETARQNAIAVLTPDQRQKLQALSDAMALVPAAHEAGGLGLLQAGSEEGRVKHMRAEPMRRHKAAERE